MKHTVYSRIVQNGTGADDSIRGCGLWACGLLYLLRGQGGQRDEEHRFGKEDRCDRRCGRHDGLDGRVRQHQLQRRRQGHAEVRCVRRRLRRRYVQEGRRGVREAEPERQDRPAGLEEDRRRDYPWYEGRQLPRHHRAGPGHRVRPDRDHAEGQGRRGRHRCARHEGPRRVQDRQGEARRRHDRLVHQPVRR